MSDTPKLAAALVAALADLTVVEKGRTANAGTYSYSYASLEDVVKLTRPVLAEHGLVALTPVHAHGNGLACTVILIHTSGERLELGPFPFPPGRDAQSTGSATTYHVRYALVAALGMAAGDDDDGAKATADSRRPDPTPVRQQAQKRTIRSGYNDLIKHLGGDGHVEQAAEAWRRAKLSQRDFDDEMSDDEWATVMAVARQVLDEADNEEPF